MLIAIILGTLGIAAVMTVEGWVFAQIHDQQDRLWRRLNVTAIRVTARTVARGASHEPAPAFDLATLDAGRATRETVLAGGNPALLIFTDPRCGPCYELLPNVRFWQQTASDRLSVYLISSGSAETNRAMTAEYGIAPKTVLLQEGAEAVQAFGLLQAPAAVLLLPNGERTGEVVYGAGQIRQLVSSAIGIELPAPAREFIRAAQFGATAPPFRRPDLRGRPVDLMDFRGSKTMLLFWSLGCHHCTEILPDMKEWEARGGPRMVVVSRGPSALNLEAGLVSPVVLDDDQSLATAFGVQGTPAAVLIDEQGIVVSEVMRGATGVRALAAYLWAPTAIGAR